MLIYAININKVVRCLAQETWLYSRSLGQVWLWICDNKNEMGLGIQNAEKLDWIIAVATAIMPKENEENLSGNYFG